MQNFKECAHVLDIACSQLTNHQSSNGLNGHHLQNGFSGCHVTNGNGFTTNGRHNGTNGHISVSNKRCYDDESIPLFKRARTADNHSNRCSNFDVSMDFEIDSDPVTPPEYNAASPADAFPRAPSPGMEIRFEEDLQFWCHMQGYGDTAESITEDSPPRGYQLKGVRSTGW
uniref:Uncharacterized protein n=1 Tax=Ciona savignyi TaxID=51511 RepID=H2YEI6_CIOSA